MNIRKLFLVCFLLIYTAASSFGQNGKEHPLSLEEALQIAQKQSYQVKTAQSQLSEANGRNLESFSGFLPSFSISENYIRSNDPVTVFSLKLKQGIFSQEDFVLSTLNDPAAASNFSTTLQVQQPLFNLDAMYGKSAAGLAVKARKQDLKRVHETVAFNVKKAYYGLIMAQVNLKAIEEAVLSATAHRDETIAAYEEGIVSRADLLTAEVRLAELVEQRIIADNQIVNAGEILKFVIGIEDDSYIIPTDSLEIPDKPRQLDNLEHIPDTRSDLRALELQSKAARRNIWLKRAGLLPHLNAFGVVELNSSEAFSEDASNWSIGVQMEWKFFDGLGHWGQSEQASAQAQMALTQYRQAEEKAKLEIREARRAVQTAEARISVGEKSVEQAKESLRIVEERFNEGLEKFSDLLDKEVALTNAKLRFLKAKHDYNLALSALQFALGSN